MSEPRNVEFPALDGTKLRGHFYSAGSNRPCIIMTQGFSGLKEHFLPDFAARFNKNGYGVLAYDNRCWGASEGSPRNHVNPSLQLQDYVDAFGFVSTLPDVDPAKIVFWGSSMSGGNSICAGVIEKRVAAVIAQLPFVSGEEASKSFSHVQHAMLAERNAIREGNPPTMLPVTAETIEEAMSGTSKAILPDPNGVTFNAEIDRRGYKREKFATMQSALAMILHEPRAVIHRLGPTPLLMVVAEKDTTIRTSLQLDAYSRALEPKQLHILKNAGHFDPYFGEAFEESVKVQLAFLERFL